MTLARRVMTRFSPLVKVARQVKSGYFVETDRMRISGGAACLGGVLVVSQIGLRLRVRVLLWRRNGGRSSFTGQAVFSSFLFLLLLCTWIIIMTKNMKINW